MKVYCSGYDLSEAVLRVSKAMPIKKTMPILEGIKISAYGTTLTVLATDLELSIEKKIKADIKVEGEVVVPGKFFVEFIKKLSNEDIELFSDESNKLYIRYMDSVSDMQCLNIEEFPPIRGVEEEVSFSINQKVFREVIDKTIFSVATEDLRPILKGVLFESENDSDEINVVSLDGFRMSVCKCNVLNKNGNIKINIPARSLSEIGKILEQDDDMCTVSIQKNYIMIDLGHTRLTSRLIEGDFPQYKKILPREFTTVVTVNKIQLENCLDRASIVSRGDKNNLIKLDIKENNMSIKSNSELGNINENVVISLKGGDVKTAFNSRYITDVFRVISEDEFITININNPTAPTVIKPVDSEKYMFMILPIKTLE